MNSYDVLSSVIWGNVIFKFNNKCMFFKHWIQSGFIYVKDLFDVYGNFHNELLLFL